jgi:hypothetical protein
MRADVVGLLVRPTAGGGDWGADFYIGSDSRQAIAIPELPGPDRIVRLDLMADAGQLVDYAVTSVDLGLVAPDSAVLAAVDSVRAYVDSAGGRTVVEARAPVSASALTGTLVSGYLRRGPDGFLLDGPLAYEAIAAGPVSVARLIDNMVYPGPLVRMTLTGRQLKALLEYEEVSLNWRTGLKRRRMALAKEYSIVTTSGFIHRRMDEIPANVEPEETSFWRVAVEILESRESL